MTDEQPKKPRKNSGQSKPYKHKLKAGDVFGELTLVQRVRDDVKTRSGNLRIRWRVKCSCGSEPFTIPQYYLVRSAPTPRTDCAGDAHRTISAIYEQEYRCWLMMHERCENPTHTAYKHYAGRGITIHPMYHKNLPDKQGFKNWLDEIGPRPSMKYSVDRIDNTRGYEPGNIRWATMKVQRANQGNRIDGKLIESSDSAS